MWHLFIGIVLQLCLSSHSRACFLPDPKLYVPVEQLILRSEKIVVATVVRDLGAETEHEVIISKPEKVADYADRYGWKPFLIEVQEYVRGDGPRTGIIYGLSAPSLAQYEKRKKALGWHYQFPESYQKMLAEYDHDFDGHANPKFWENHGGRETPDTDCAIHPTFQVGSKYLLFSGKQHVKAYERVESEDDRWLMRVKGWLGK